MRGSHDALVNHLAWWGLRRFESDAAYFAWQREAINPADLTRLNQLVEQKRDLNAGPNPEIAFYDFSAEPQILPVLYSQRHDYYLAVGPLVTERIRDARSVLDFGCGPGILTTFYAQQCPSVLFMGIDRSETSIRAAQERAEALGLSNIRFERLDAERTSLSGTYDLIVCSHALLQSESDPGIPSADWRTFERPNDERAQADFERRTGLGIRLGQLCEVLAPNGRMLLFEKTRQLARRIPFQRALAARGFELVEPPLPIRYRVVEEVMDDGPFYVLERGPSGPARQEDGLSWNEEPEYPEGQGLYRCEGEAAKVIWERLPGRDMTSEISCRTRLGPIRAEWGRWAGSLAYLYLKVSPQPVFPSRKQGSAGVIVTGSPKAIESIGRDQNTLEAILEEMAVTSIDHDDLVHLPLYENHTVLAQSVWSALPDRRVLKATTLEEPCGRQLHVELGAAGDLIYMYWANTFDQRQVVIVESQRARMLEQYYEEFLDGR